MSVKRVVDTKFWTDDKVIEQFSPEDKLFMLYLLTNPHTTQLGIYSINKKVMAFELGYSIDTINVLIDRFENKYKMIRYTEETKEIAIKNYLKYSIIKGGKPVEDLLVKEIKQVKDKSLLKYISNTDYEVLNDTIKKIMTMINDNDNDNDNDNEDTFTYRERIVKPLLINAYREITSYLNEKAKTNYKPTTRKTIDLIKARINEGFSVDDFKIVIDKKCNDWLDDKEMSKYLRPETLFGTKFESYLNQPAKKMTTKDLEKYVDANNFFNKGEEIW